MKCNVILSWENTDYYEYDFFSENHNDYESGESAMLVNIFDVSLMIYVNVKLITRRTLNHLLPIQRKMNNIMGLCVNVCAVKGSYMYTYTYVEIEKI